MRIHRYELWQGNEPIGMVAVQEQAVNAAKMRAEQTGNPVSVIAELDNGEVREIVVYPNGNIERDWKNVVNPEENFMSNQADGYAIYQLKRNVKTSDIRFMSYGYLENHDLKVLYENYDAVYSGQLPNMGNLMEALEYLYMRFNIDRPQDFVGHSLSVSDVVVLKRNGAYFPYYVNSIGFVNIPEFMPKQISEGDKVE